MPTNYAVRTSVVFTQRQADRLAQICDTHKVSRNHFITACATVLSDNEVQGVLDRYREFQRLEKELRLEADNMFLKYIQGKTPAEIRSMWEAARNATSAK